MTRRSRANTIATCTMDLAKALHALKLESYNQSSGPALAPEPQVEDFVTVALEFVLRARRAEVG
jgi:hypothetical protein